MASLIKPLHFVLAFLLTRATSAVAFSSETAVTNGVQNVGLNNFLNSKIPSFLPWAVREGYEPYSSPKSTNFTFRNALYSLDMTLSDISVKGVVATLDFTTLGGFRSSLSNGEFHAQFYSRGKLTGGYVAEGTVASVPVTGQGMWEMNCTTSGVVQARFEIESGYTQLRNLTTDPAYTGGCFGSFESFLGDDIPVSIRNEVVTGLQSEISFEIGVQELLIPAMEKYLAAELRESPLFDIVGM